MQETQKHKKIIRERSIRTERVGKKQSSYSTKQDDKKNCTKKKKLTG